LPNLRALYPAWGKWAVARAVVWPLLALASLAPNPTESAKANGETRTLYLTEPHTNESGTFTYMVNGSYDQSVIEKLNWFLRDWRHDEQIKMDPKLFDVVWEVYRESGSSQPIEVLSAYRSPDTNAMLRRRSRQVAEHSQHILGKAMDAHFVDVPTSKIRDIAMRMQDGGVGFYPTGMTPWVHLDTGSVRYWPRMSRDSLARLFPDGKTVYIPADGQPMAGYEQARAEIEARGGSVFAASAYEGHPKSLLAMLFGGGEEEGDEEAANIDSPRGRMMAMASAGTGAPGRAGASQQSFFAGGTQVASAQPDALTKAKRDLPQGETYMSAPAAAAPAAEKPQPEAAAAPDTQDGDAAAPPTPTPPHRPIGFASLGFQSAAPAPTPPIRPTEFAGLQPKPSDVSDTARKNDQIAMLLSRKLPGVITRGLGGALPENALSLADADVPLPPQRAALLAKAAALAAPPPPPAPPRLPPLMRAARLYAPIPPIGPPKPALVAARLDGADFVAMTAPATPSVSIGETKGAPPTPRADALVVALIPTAEVSGSFSASAPGGPKSDAFGAARHADPSSLLDSESLRGTD
jgi:uncharacterized protein YcbK (DUF882 family)